VAREEEKLKLGKRAACEPFMEQILKKSRRSLTSLAHGCGYI
jgi:hypothetical protein